MIDSFVNLIRFSAPVGLAALGESVGQKAGVINVGLEGTMVTAAYGAMVTTQVSGSPWLGLLVGVVIGALFALVQAFFTLKIVADQVVVGTAINLLGLGLSGTLYRMRYGSSGQLLSVVRLPHDSLGFDAVLWFWLIATLTFGWLLAKSMWGLILRATGEHPDSARASGFSPIWVRLQGSVVSGLFAGLAGSYLAVGVTGSFAENMTAGRGFVALAMVTFGRWKPVWVFLASLLIGYAESLQYELQGRNINWPPQFFIAFPYVVALVVLIAFGRGASAPAALGQPYVEDK